MNAQYENAWESWTLYDTVLVSSIVDTLYKNSGFYTDYAALGAPATIPFLNVRNKSVGVPYNNFDSKDKLPFVFECWSIGIEFSAPAITYPPQGGGVTSDQSQSTLLFAQELPKHCGFILKLSQDEKLVQTALLAPSGQGVYGASSDVASQATNAQLLQNVSAGVLDRNNRWKFAEPVLMPREVNLSGELVISEYGRSMLAKMIGPGDYWIQQDDGERYAAASYIRVSMYGKREVQQRNALHFT